MKQSTSCSHGRSAAVVGATANSGAAAEDVVQTAPKSVNAASAMQLQMNKVLYRSLQHRAIPYSCGTTTVVVHYHL